MTTTMYPFNQIPTCPMCGSEGGVVGGKWCGGGFYFKAGTMFFLGHCKVRTLNHRHYYCMLCGFRHIRACRDARERSIR